MSCTKGTYIRSLIYDIGEKIDTGAHVQELRRVSIGNIDTFSMVSIEELEQAFNNESYKGLEKYRKSAKDIMRHLPYIYISNNELLSLKQGKLLSNKLITDNILSFTTNQKIRLFLENKNNFVGVGLINADRKIIPQIVI